MTARTPVGSPVGSIVIGIVAFAGTSLAILAHAALTTTPAFA